MIACELSVVDMDVKSVVIVVNVVLFKGPFTDWIFLKPLKPLLGQ